MGSIFGAPCWFNCMKIRLGTTPLHQFDWTQQWYSIFHFSKNKNRTFKMKVFIYTNSNILNLVHLSCFWHESRYPFWQISSRKSKLFKLLPKEIRICLILMRMFICPPLDWKYTFWANLVQKIKIVCLRWKLILRLI